MLLLLVDIAIYRYMKEYLINITKILIEELNIHSEIFIYSTSNKNIPSKFLINEWDNIVFVQRIDEYIYITFRKKSRKRNDINRRIFLLNTEQTTRDKLMNNLVYKDINKYNVHIIDYSLENIKIIKNVFPNIKYIHFPFPFEICNEEDIDKNKDVISLKSSLYRRNIINSLDVKVNDFLNKWGEERDEIISQHKVLLNIHFDKNYKIFESIRCFQALKYRTLIVSERSVEDEKTLFKDYIFFVDIKDMNTKLNDVLSNYEKYYSEIFSEKNIINIKKVLKDIYKKQYIYLNKLNYNNF